MNLSLEPWDDLLGTCPIRKGCLFPIEPYLIWRFEFIDHPDRQCSNCSVWSRTRIWSDGQQQLISLRLTWYLLHRLGDNCAGSVMFLSNCSPRLLAHTMLHATHLSSIVTTWLILRPVATQRRLSTRDIPSACDTYTSPHLVCSEMSIAKRIRDTGEACGTLACTWYWTIASPSITISNSLSKWNFPVICNRSPSVYLTFFKLPILPFSVVRKAASMTLARMPGIWPWPRLHELYRPWWEPHEWLTILYCFWFVHRLVTPFFERLPTAVPCQLSRPHFPCSSAAIWSCRL